MLFTFAKLHKDEIKAVLFDLNIDFIIVLNRWLQSLSPSYSLKTKNKTEISGYSKLVSVLDFIFKMFTYFCSTHGDVKKNKNRNKQTSKQTNKQKLKDKDVFKLATSII